jgi:hypothetical protein
MTPDESMAELVRMFAGPPQPRGKCRWQHRQYDLVRFDDGTIAFLRNAFDAEMERTFVEALDELFGPEPAVG